MLGYCHLSARKIAQLGLILSGAALSLPATDSLGSVQLPETWSLAQAVDFAINNNPEVHIALERLAASQAMTDKARSYTLPGVSLGTEYSQTDTPMYSFGNILNQGAFDNSIDFNNPGRTDNLAFQAMLEYRLYDGGTTQAGKQHAEAEQRAAARKLAAIHQQLAYEIVRSYYAILQAEEMLEVRHTAVRAIEASLAVGKARFDAGDLLQEDLLNLELQQAREVENRIRATHDLALARQVFWNLLGLHPGQQGTLPTSVEPQTVPNRLDHSARMEIQVLLERIAAAEALLARASGGLKPVVDSYASYQYEYGTVLGEAGDSWQAGVRLKYSLYNGHRTEAEIAAARAGLAEMRAMKAQLELALDLELQKAQLTYQQTVERLQVTAKMVEVAAESTQLARIRFKEGIILASDLIDSEMRLSDAQARRASARAENAIAVANLRRATGIGQFAEQTAFTGETK